jgi:hypothetical protein
VHAVASTPDAIHLLEAIVDYDKNRWTFISILHLTL